MRERPMSRRQTPNWDSLTALATQRWVRISELAPFTCYSRQTLHAWCKSGRLPASQRGGKHWWVNMTALKEAIANEKGMKEFFIVPFQTPSTSDPEVIADALATKPTEPPTDDIDTYMDNDSDGPELSDG